MLKSVLQKTVLPWQRGGCSVGHLALSGLASQGRRRAVQHQKEQTEVPEPLPVPLVEEALGVGVAEEAAAHSCLSIGGESSCQVMW